MIDYNSTLARGLSEFNGVKASVKFVCMDEETENGQTWDHNVWSATLRTDGRQFTVTYRTGLGIKGTPTAEDILSAVLSDAGTAVYTDSFEDWADNLGYDTDSRKAERIYRTVIRQTASLKRLLGDRYSEFLALEF
jgi:hypothetical protein